MDCIEKVIESEAFFRTEISTKDNYLLLGLKITGFQKKNDSDEQGE